jgi:hypothetical protein
MEAYLPQASRGALARLLPFQASTARLAEVQAYLTRDVAIRAGLAVAAIYTVYLSGLVIYRLFLSPLAKFPGPKIAAVTSYYELYYDVIHKGKYIFQIEKMHDKYGIFLLSFNNSLPTLSQESC